MPSCFVPGCRSGYARCSDNKHFFTPPKDKKQFSKWVKAISRKDMQLSRKSRICDSHFSKDRIIKADCFVVNGEKVELPRLKWKLKPDSVPHIFPNLPKYLSTPLKSRRKPPSRKVSEEILTKRKKKDEDMTEPSEFVMPETSEMEMDVVIKPEPVWLLEDQEVLAGMKTEVEPIVSSDEAREYPMQDNLSCSPKAEENTYHNLMEVKDEPSLSPSGSDESNEEIKTKIEFDESLLEDSSESFLSCKESTDASEQERRRNVTSTDQARDIYVEKRYKCAVCSKCFKRSDHLTKHIRTHTGDKPFKCNMCSKCFTQSDGLARHMKNHTGDKPFKCNVCSKCFMMFDHLSKHMRIHTGDKPFKCKLCSKCFTQSGDLARHTRTHTGDKPFQCEICSKSFTQSGHLVNHLRTHTGDKPFQCEVCTKCFTQSESLVMHMRTHTGDKPFKCDLCNKAFKQSGHLAKHKKTHTGEKPFKCEVCSKCFSEFRHLSNHVRNHTGDKPYKCIKCNKCFIHSSDLARHTRTHTGDKPFKCEMCNKCFTQSGHLSSHIKTHSGNNTLSI